MTVIRVAFYTWVVVSLVGLVVYRRRKRTEGLEDGTATTSERRTERTRRPSRTAARRTTEITDEEITGRRALPQEPPPPIPEVDLSAPSRPVAPVVPRDLLEARGVDPPGGSAGDGGAPAPAGGAAATDEAVHAVPPPVGGERRGLFAAGSPAAPVTIAQALEGVTWPCGLVPVIRMEDLHQADRRVVFSTVGVAAAEVGRKVADALEAVGYAVSSLDDATALARRGPVAVAMVLHPDAAKVHTAGRPEFPMLPAGSVVVVCDLQTHAG